jgi:RNA polymerase sigma-70 factor, ECF subfamily
VEGLSTEEVANITNLSVPAVKSRLHRARAFLRNELAPIFDEQQNG